MEAQNQEYRGHRIELRRRAAERGIERLPADGDSREEFELLIDGQKIAYAQLPDGSYVLPEEYAYDARQDVVDLARRFIDYRSQNP
jgi:hypothetical protein